MNKILIFISFVTISIFGYCDTLDDYHAYLNDSLIGQYNSLSEKLSIELKTSELNNFDVIIVRYGTDECVYSLSTLIEVNEKRRSNYDSTYSISIIELSKSEFSLENKMEC